MTDDATPLGLATTESDALFRAIFTSAPDGVVVVDARGTIQSANPMTTRIFGYEEAELVGRNVDILVPKGLHEQHARDVANYVENGEAMIMAFGRGVIGVRKDGSVVPLEIGLSKSAGADGATRVIAIVRDITERMHAEAERERLLEELSRSNRELEQFAYITSHDLRSPMRGVGTLAQFIMEDAADVLPEKSRQDLMKMQSRIRAMNRMLDGLLAYARVSQQDAEPEALSVRRIVADIAETLDLPTGLVVEVATDLPDITTVRAPFEQVLRNLIDNAVKHHDRPTGSIRISGVRQGSLVEYSVTDDGPGIEPDHHERIFRLFQALPESSFERGGGLGLSLVRRAVHAHGGTVTLDSAPGRGSTFTFTWKDGA